MSAALGQIGAAIGAVKMMAGLKAAWTRASKDGERLLKFGWLRYYGGRDPHEGKRCETCKKPLTAAELESRMLCCKACWYERLAESQAPRSVGVRFEP